MNGVASSLGKGSSSSFIPKFTDVDMFWVFLDGLLILFCLWILVPRSFFDDEDDGKEATAPAVVLPVPIAVDIPESKHVEMEVSLDDKTWVEAEAEEQD